MPVEHGLDLPFAGSVIGPARLQRLRRGMRRHGVGGLSPQRRTPGAEALRAQRRERQQAASAEQAGEPAQRSLAILEPLHRQTAADQVEAASQRRRLRVHGEEAHRGQAREPLAAMPHHVSRQVGDGPVRIRQQQPQLRRQQAAAAADLQDPRTRRQPGGQDAPRQRRRSQALDPGCPFVTGRRLAEAPGDRALARRHADAAAAARHPGSAAISRSIAAVSCTALSAKRILLLPCGTVGGRIAMPRKP